MKRRLLTLLLTLVAAISAQARYPLRQALDESDRHFPMFDRFNARSHFDDIQPDRIEGIWRLTSDDDARFAIIRHPRLNCYLMITVDATNRLIMPGTLMGALAPTAKKDVYDAEIYTSTSGSALSRPKPFVLTLNPLQNALIFEDGSTKTKINLWRLIPYMYRFTVSRHNQRPDNLDGALRIYPLPDHPHFGPRPL